MSWFQSPFNFNIHHIFPIALFGDSETRQALADAGITQEANGNKVALFVNPTLAALAGTNPSFVAAGFGGSPHFGGHPGYSNFLRDTIRDILDDSRNPDGTLSDAQKADLAGLHKFATDVSYGRVDGVQVTSIGTNLFEGAYEKDYANLSDSEKLSHLNSPNYDQTLTDEGITSNPQARLDQTEKFLQQMRDDGVIVQSVYEERTAKLEAVQQQITQGVEARFLPTGMITNIHIQTAYDAAKAQGSPLVHQFKFALSKFSADLFVGADGATGFDPNTLNSFGNVLATVASDRVNLPDSLSSLGANFVENIANGLSSILVGIGGGFIGDFAEFLNASYDSIKIWIDTGDSTAFQENVAEFGVALALSAAVIAGTIAIAGALGAPAAAAVAAAWVAYGVYDGLSNILELIEKIGDDRPYWQETLEDLDFAIELPVDPLVIDLDGDGLELVSLEDSSAYFDLDGDGFAENTGWVAPDDGLLAIDSNGNGQIDDISELFGTERTTGYEELAQLDSNGDGVIDANDAAFADLLVWQDFNGDGSSSIDELSTLDEVGITSIDVTPTDVNQTIEGNQVIETADVTFADGSTTQSWEVLFNMSQLQSEANLPDAFEYDEAVFTRPYLHGFGDVADLWVSMTEDPDLLQDSINLTETARTGDYAAFTSGFDDFLYQWSGVEDMVWRQDVEDLYAHFVFDEARMQEIIDEVTEAQLNPDTSNDPNNGSGSGDASYEGPRPSILAFVFGTSGPEYRVSEDELHTYLGEIDGYSPYHQFDDQDYWNFTYTTLPRPDHSAGVGSSENGIRFTIQELPEAQPESAPAMDVQQFVFLQKISGQDYRLADNFIAPENVVVATPSEAEIPALEDAYAEVRDYMTARFLVQSVQSILAEEGADADLGALEPFGHLTYNPFSDEIFGYTNDFVTGIIEQFRNDGLGTDAEALALLATFANDVDGIAPLVAANYPEIDINLIASTFDVHFDAVGSDSADAINVSGAGIVVGHDGDDTITGGSEASVFIGGLGDDTIDGGDGIDIYIYRAGDGNDVIRDYGFITHDNDELWLVDYTVDEVQFLRAGSGLLIQSWDGGSITIENYFADYYDYQIAEISFADGVVLDKQEIRDKTVEDQKSTGTIIGSAGIEHYYHSTGDGSYVIDDVTPRNVNVNDQLIFTDMLVGDAVFSQVGSDLVITLISGETITVRYHFYSSSRDMEEIVFADGTILDRQGIIDKTEVDDQRARDQAVADQKAAGNAVVTGTHLAENYVHTSGDGSYIIRDEDRGSNSGIDTLTFTDINSTDVTMIQNNYDLIITASDGETVTIDNYFIVNYDFVIDEIIFADGVTMGWQEMRDRSVADQKAEGYAVITGTELEENYVHTSGDGSYVIRDEDRGSNSATDTLTFTDINSTDVTMIQDNYDLIITASDGETVTIDDYFVINGDFVIDDIIFADGATLGWQDVRDRSVADQKAAGYAVVTGTELEENYFHSSGDGSYMIQDFDPGTNNATDTFSFVDLNSDDVSLSQGDTNDLLMATNQGETITIDNYFDSDSDYLIDQIVFADGVSYGVDDVNALLIA